MIVLGLDPGTTRAGYAIIEKSAKLRLIDCGILRVSGKNNHSRITEAGEHFESLIKTHKPDFLSIEKLFFVNNQKTGLQVAEIRGVMIYLAGKHSVPVKEYAPTEVKNMITGSGQADKKAVEKMVKLHLEIPEQKLVDDVYDAIAIGLAGIYDIKRGGAVEKIS